MIILFSRAAAALSRSCGTRFRARKAIGRRARAKIETEQSTHSHEQQRPSRRRRTKFLLAAPRSANNIFRLEMTYCLLCLCRAIEFSALDDCDAAESGRSAGICSHFPHPSSFGITKLIHIRCERRCTTKFDLNTLSRNGCEIEKKVNAVRRGKEISSSLAR